ncbi:MAG TPA: DoxX family membrane protein [Microlunatus sp.]|nr:DoxX family membrane protein [Microlunatus sp.]
MSLIRAAARTLLASYFVASGVKAITNPARLVPAAEPLADKVVPLVKQYAPEQVAGFVPEDAKTLVRINGAAEVIGGVALATGVGRRLGALLLAGSLVPSTIARYPFWTREDPEQKAEDRTNFLKNMSLLGGVLLAAVDTEGKPSLAYRAHKGGRAIAKDTKKISHKAAKSTHALTNAALAEGAMLAGAVVSQSRKARRQAAKQAADARKAAERAAKPVLRDAKSSAKDAQKQFAKAQKKAGKAAGNLSVDASKKAAELSKAAGQKAAELQRGAQQHVKKAQKAVSDVTANITLGDN